MLPEGYKLTKKINVHNHANKKDVQIAYHIQVMVDWKAMKAVGRETIQGLNTNKIVIITLRFRQNQSFVQWKLKYVSYALRTEVFWWL